MSTNNKDNKESPNGEGTQSSAEMYRLQRDTEEENEPKKCAGYCECLCLKKISNGIVWGLETAFYRLGKLVARNPFKIIIACLVVCGVAGLGLMRWHEEKEYVKVWLPRGSRMFDEYNWVQKNFPESTRFESVIVEDENVLSPESINAILDLYEKSHAFKTNDGHTLDTLCVKAGPICRVSNILELWSFDAATIRNLSSLDIYNTVNQKKIISPLYRNEIDLEKLLGHIRRDNISNIISAGATTMFWFLERNTKIQKAAEDWEKQLIETINDVGHRHLRKLYIYTARTFDDEGIGAVNEDMVLLTIGFGLVFLYVTFNFGYYSFVEHKIFLSAAGLFSIGLSIIFTYGVGLGTGIMFGPIHQITPFMLLGIGVDDMFVIIESTKHLTPKEKGLPVEERIALALKHSGVSITVTSITDIVAFGIGSSTVIPSLSTFCVYASIGVFALYILQSTYFIACLTLDERRIDSRRNACLLCYKHEPGYKPNKYYNLSLQHLFMKKIWAPLLTYPVVKILVIIVAMCLTGVNIWSFIQLKHDFDPSMYLPSDSYSTRYVEADRQYFPGDGAFVSMYCSDMDYSLNLDKLMHLYELIKEKTTIQSSTVDFWLASFQRWTNATHNQIDIFSFNNSGVYSQGLGLYDLLRSFLMTEHGRAYFRYIKMDNITNPTTILGSILTFRHIKCTTSKCNIDAMDDMRHLVDEYSFRGGGSCFVYSNPQYMFNETNKVLKLELYRNLALAAVCVFVVTLVLIANFWTSILVFLCVVFTVIDVAGTMQFWGISVDTASSVILILCFGLAVDYSAHIGHTFMTVTGSNNERARQTLISIGPAVFSGGFSTFLAFLLLVNSVSYGFTLFFRIFTSVVIFGLFHGLTFLPVLLSMVGPAPYETNTNINYASKYSDVKDNPENISPEHLHDFYLKEHDITKTAMNGKLGKHKSASETNVNNGYLTTNDQNNPRYSGSYYEQTSNGSLVQITMPDSRIAFNNKSSIEVGH